MLDLTKIIKEYYEIKTEEGDILQIKYPTQRLLTKFVQIQSVAEMETPQTVNLLYDCLLDIFNLNINGKHFDKEYIEKFDIKIVALIFQDYLEFVGNELGK